jgi:hypothetical protein
MAGNVLPNGRVTPGMPIEKAFSARTWNRFCNITDFVAERQYGNSGGATPTYMLRPQFLFIKSFHNEIVPQYGVLGIGSVSSGGPGTAVERMQNFSAEIVLFGDAPVSGVHEDRFAITLEPIEPGEIGRCVVDGVVPCRIERSSFLHNYATIKNYDVTQLQSAECGLMQILADGETGDGSSYEDRWAIGRL